MTIPNRLIGLCLATCFLFLSTTELYPAPSTDPNVKKVTLDFKDAQLEEVVRTISELTGKNFVYDRGLKGDITIVSPQSVTVEEAYELFLTVLNIKGFTVVPSGRVFKIVPVAQARESNLPTVIRPPQADSPEQYITRLIPLKYVDATVIAQTVLQPLLPKTSSVAAYAPTNTLVVTDNAANIDRLVRIVRQLDIPSSLGKFEIIPLEHASAEEVAEICQQFFSRSAPTAAAAPEVQALRKRLGGRGGGPAPAGEILILPYPRTNALILMADSTDLAEIRHLIRHLDSKRKPGSTHFHVYRLENADAETLAKTLNETLTKIPGGRTQSLSTAKAPGDQASTLSTSVINADKPTNSLLINASPEDYEIIQALIEQLDIRRKQVYVEALLIELSMDATKNLGVSLQGAAEVGKDGVIVGGSNLNTGANTLSSVFAGDEGGSMNLLSQTIQGILLGGIFNPITVTGLNGETLTIPAISALIQLSKTTADVDILSAPRLLTSDNEEAEIIVGSNVPIITNRLTDTGSSGLATSVAVERQDVALTLRFTPQITAGNLVRLKVYQEITDVTANSVGDVNEVGPTLTKRLIQNSILAENGQTVVMGGLTSTNVQERITRVPMLASIPGIGWLFKTKSTTEKKTNLFVFITAHIINDASDIQRITGHNHQEVERQRQEMEKIRNQKDFPARTEEKPDKKSRYRSYSRDR